MTPLYMPPCTTIPILPPRPKISFSSRSRMNASAAGQRLLILSCSCTIGHRRQHDAVEIRTRVRQRVLHGQRRALVVAGGEAAGDMAGPDPHHQHDGGVRRLGQFEPVAHRLDDAGQVRARVQKPELRFHRKGMAAFLHDAGAFAVILAHDDQRAAGDARGGQVRQRVRGHVDPDRALEGARPRGSDNGPRPPASPRPPPRSHWPRSGCPVRPSGLRHRPERPSDG